MSSHKTTTTTTKLFKYSARTECAFDTNFVRKVLTEYPLIIRDWKSTRGDLPDEEITFKSSASLEELREALISHLKNKKKYKGELDYFLSTLNDQKKYNGERYFLEY